MSYSSLGKKLRPAKKALKGFTNTLKSKLHNLNLSKAVKIIKTSTNRLLAYCSGHFFPPFKKRSITKPKCRSRQYNHLYNKTLLHNNNFSPIYIDNLYDAEPSLMPASCRHFHAHAETSSRGDKDVTVDQKVVPKREGKLAREQSLYSIEDAWREVVARSPQLRPVDERAEEFIHKFREQIKLQKDKSLLEFEERLDRSG